MTPFSQKRIAFVRTTIALFTFTSFAAGHSASAIEKLFFVSDAFQGAGSSITQQSIADSKAVANKVEERIQEAYNNYGWNSHIITTELNNASGSLAQYENVIDEVWSPLLSYVHAVPGNHDYNTYNASGFYSYFDNSETYHSFKIETGAKDWNIIGIDSNWDKLSFNQWQKQLSWLESEVQKEACTIVYFHHPRWSSGDHGNNSQMQDVWEILTRNNVELALSGHDHNFEIFDGMDEFGNRDNMGTIQIVAGIGGADVDSRDMGTIKPNSYQIIEKRHGFIEFILHDGLVVTGAYDEEGHAFGMYVNICH
ncbi:MAG: metallophosphoesterase [Deltaproteobacteria bacterium]|nr:metallophosphoesterase [Deltaproteobacteria bacterium]